jgi:molybdenum-dependent DNA-binding transcriptional regulator ModE
MKHNLRIIGKDSRHITRFEKNALSKVADLCSINHAEIIYDDTLYDVDSLHYLLLSVEKESGGKIVTTTSGKNQYEAFIKAVRLLKRKIKADLNTQNDQTIINMQSRENIQIAV